MHGRWNVYGSKGPDVNNDRSVRKSPRVAVLAVARSVREHPSISTKVRTTSIRIFFWRIQRLGRIVGYCPVVTNGTERNYVLRGWNRLVLRENYTRRGSRIYSPRYLSWLGYLSRVPKPRWPFVPVGRNTWIRGKLGTLCYGSERSTNRNERLTDGTGCKM